MGIIVLKIIGCICATAVSVVLAYRNEEDYAVTLEIMALAIIFITWDKLIQSIQ